MNRNLILLFCLIISTGLMAQYHHFDAALGLQHADVTTADIDNDGDLDIIASGVTKEGTVTVAKSFVYINNNGAYELQGTGKGATYYQNPIFEPDLADPTVIRAADGWFYAYGTQNTWPDGVNHLVPIVKSKNLIQWQFVGNAFNSRPSWKSAGGIWAPDVTYTLGKYYMFYSVSTWGDANPGIGLAIADSPAGPFVDQGKLFDSQSIGVSNSIDPFLFQTTVADTLQNYLFWGSFFGIYGIQLSSDLKSTVGAKFKIAGNAFEAPYIFEKDGKFYFFGSLGTCCDGVNSQYHVNMAVATSPKGPFRDKAGNSILGDGQAGSQFLVGNKNIGWVGPGHNSKIVTDDAGNHYFIYHAINVDKPNLPNGATRRPILMDKINWVSGWPYIISNIPGKGLLKAPVINP